MPSAFGAERTDDENNKRDGGYAKNERYRVGCTFPEKIGDKSPIQQQNNQKEEKQSTMIRADKADFVGFFARHRKELRR